MVDAHMEVRSSLVQVNCAQKDQMEKWQSKDSLIEMDEVAGVMDRHADQAKLDMFPSVSLKKKIPKD